VPGQSPANGPEDDEFAAADGRGGDEAGRACSSAVSRAERGRGPPAPAAPAPGARDPEIRLPSLRRAGRSRWRLARRCGRSSSWRPRSHGPVVHSSPFRVKDCGAAVLPSCVPWKPNVTVSPGAIVPLYGALVAVTCPLDGEIVAFQADVTACPDGRVNVSDQPLTGEEPWLVTDTEAVKPVFQGFIV